VRSRGLEFIIQSHSGEFIIRACPRNGRAIKRPPALRGPRPSVHLPGPAKRHIVNARGCIRPEVCLSGREQSDKMWLSARPSLSEHLFDLAANHFQGDSVSLQFAPASSCGDTGRHPCPAALNGI